MYIDMWYIDMPHPLPLDDCPLMQVDGHDVGPGPHGDPLHLPLRQHVVDKLIPRHETNRLLQIYV